MKQKDFAIIPISENAITLEFGPSPGQKKSQHVENIKQQLSGLKPKGILDILPAYTSLTIIYDFSIWMKTGPTGSPFHNLSRFLEQKLNASTAYTSNAKEIKKIPVCYDPEFGIDLFEASEKLDLSKDELIQLHHQKDYTVFMIGFLPGFPYLGKTNKKIHISRKSSPRTLVPKGSIAIADFQTGIYPVDSPGGWNIIGRTPLELINMDEGFKSRLEAGDKVRFYPIERDEFDLIQKEQAWG